MNALGILMQDMDPLPTKTHLRSHAHSVAHHSNEFTDTLMETFYLPSTWSREIWGPEILSAWNYP